MFFRWLFGSFVLLPICFTAQPWRNHALIVSEPCKMYKAYRLATSTER